MAKRHVAQSEKQKNGQFFTTNADNILAGWEQSVVGHTCVDPFSGAGDLLSWASKNGASDVIGYDLHPTSSTVRQNDSLLNPPNCSGMFLISNPPYLAANKCRDGDKRPYAQWGQSDYYKCHIAALDSMGVERGIMILPSNFLCESADKARRIFFADYRIISAKIWTEPIFSDATTGIVALLFERRHSNVNYDFPLLLLPDNKWLNWEPDPNNKFLYGRDFFEYVNKQEYNFAKVVDLAENNSHIVISCLDGGRLRCGFHYNESEPLVVKPSQITTFQIRLQDVVLSEKEERQVIAEANRILTTFRNQYNSMFLSNYMGAKQKIMSVSIAFRILSRAIENIIGIKDTPKNNLFDFE